MTSKSLLQYWIYKNRQWCLSNLYQNDKYDQIFFEWPEIFFEVSIEDQSCVLRKSQNQDTAIKYPRLQGLCLQWLSFKAHTNIGLEKNLQLKYLLAACKPNDLSGHKEQIQIYVENVISFSVDKLEKSIQRFDILPTRKYNFITFAFLMQIEENSSFLIIGYFPVRAKAQIIRLLCQFSHVPYRDRFFTPKEWIGFKETEGGGWVIKDIPFIQHQGFIITGGWAMVRYIVDLSNNYDLLGKTQKDRIRIDQIKNKRDLKDVLISLITKVRSSGCCLEKIACIKQFYQTKIEPVLLKYEQESCFDNFFFGYLTVFDFILYETINYIKVIYNYGLLKLPKLVAVRNKVAEIPQIKNYQESPRAVTELSPVHFFEKFKEKLTNA